MEPPQPTVGTGLDIVLMCPWCNVDRVWDDYGDTVTGHQCPSCGGLCETDTASDGEGWEYLFLVKSEPG